MQRDPEQTEVRHLKAIADFNNAHILEIGCGDGRLTWRYAQDSRQVTAVDPDSSQLAAAIKARPKY